MPKNTNSFIDVFFFSSVVARHVYVAVLSIIDHNATHSQLASEFSYTNTQKHIC